MFDQPDMPNSSSSFFKQLEKKLKSDDVKLPLYFGVGLIALFLVTSSLAPQIGEKLGTLSLKKRSQATYAATKSSSVFVRPQKGASPQPAPQIAVAVQDYPVEAEVKALFDLINNYRAQNGRAALTPSYTLSEAAKWMANDMASKNYWPDDEYCKQFGLGAHCDSLGRDFETRLAAFGYPTNTWRGENLATVAATAQEALDAFKGSPNHNTNLLWPDFAAVGVSRAYNAASTYDWYWAVDFGGVVDIPVNYVVASSNGTILGRIFIDVNTNGIPDNGDMWIMDPSISCAYGTAVADARVDYSGPASGSARATNCPADGYPYYAVSVPSGTYTITGVAPSGWQVTGIALWNGSSWVVLANPASVSVGGGGSYQTWIGMRPSPTCNASQVGSNQFTSCLWKGKNFDALDSAAPATSVLSSPVPDSAIPIDLNWGTGTPSSIVGTDVFSTRWKGTFIFKAGTYTFTAGSDDGMRVYVDGVLKIDQWVDRGYSENSFSMTFTSQAQHTIRVDYFEHLGSAQVKLGWTYNADSDNDGFSYQLETYVGTDPFDNCADNGLDNAWPPDINNDRYVDITDIGIVAAAYGKTATGSKKRLDLNADGFIDISDKGIVANYFGRTCI